MGVDCREFYCSEILAGLLVIFGEAQDERHALRRVTAYTVE